MLAIPLAVGEANEHGKKVREWCLANSFIDASNDGVFELDMQNFQSSRDKAVQLTACFDEIGMAPLVRYSDMLSVIAPRLKGYDGSAFEFKWFDPFQKARPTIVSSCIYFEWGNILWNLLAVESLIGAKVDRSNVEGIKAACKRFQIAAGIAEFILNSVLPHFSRDVHVATHLSKESLEMVKLLMLSQAQSCFYEMAVQQRNKAGSMKPPVVAKIAAQTAVYFELVAQECRNPSIMKGLEPTWKGTAEFNAAMFCAAAEYVHNFILLYYCSSFFSCL